MAPDAARAGAEQETDTGAVAVGGGNPAPTVRGTRHVVMIAPA